MRNYLIKVLVVIGASWGIAAVIPWTSSLQAQTVATTLAEATNVTSTGDAIPAGTLLALIPFIIDRAIKVIELILQNRRDKKNKQNNEQ